MLRYLHTNKLSGNRLARTKGIQDSCRKCGICTKECDFLMRYGHPGIIAEKYKTNPQKWAAVSFECSLCGLCTSVCPEALDPCQMFHEFRKQAVEKDQQDFKAHKNLLKFEKKGTSKKYTYYSLPDGCDTIFFPGCSLAGTRPNTILNAYQYLQTHIRNIGIVLDCCTKPSHDLGRQDYFTGMFTELKTYLLELGVHTVITACPNCYTIFNTYAPECIVETLYEIMARKGLNDKKKVAGAATVHDPCPTRFENNIQHAVRSVIKTRGIDIIDTPHRNQKTFCCGEGGAVGCLSSDLASSWTKKRIREAHPHKIISYCAGCVNLFSKTSDSFHVLDLVFEPEHAINKKIKPVRAPFTYFNRLNLKKKIKTFAAENTRERTYTIG